MFESIGSTVDPASYARLLKVDLHAEYKAAAAAKLMRVGVGTLNAAANNAELPYIAMGSRNRIYIGQDLILWKLSKRTRLVNTTSPKTALADGVDHGTTNRPSKPSHQALALQALKPQSRS